MLLEPALTRTTADWLAEADQREASDAKRLRAAGLPPAASGVAHLGGEHAGAADAGDGAPRRGRRRANSVGLSEQDGDGMVLGDGGALKLLQGKGEAERRAWRRSATAAKIIALISGPTSSALPAMQGAMQGVVGGAVDADAPPLPARTPPGVTASAASLLSARSTIREIDIELRAIRQRTLEGRTANYSR